MKQWNNSQETNTVWGEKDCILLSWIVKEISIPTQCFTVLNEITNQMGGAWEDKAFPVKEKSKRQHEENSMSMWNEPDILCFFLDLSPLTILSPCRTLL